MGNPNLRIRSNTVTPGLFLELYVAACHGQIEPDAENCAVCGDIGHQGFECPHNPFLKFLQACAGLDLRIHYPNICTEKEPK